MMPVPVETVLVVDDEPMLRELEVQILRLQGYQVLQAADAAEALRLAGEQPDIHLLITDLCMPKTNGFQLVRRFREVHPRTPVLLVSGSVASWDELSAEAPEKLEFLAKPFASTELLRKVRILVDTAIPILRRKSTDGG